MKRMPGIESVTGGWPGGPLRLWSVLAVLAVAAACLGSPEPALARAHDPASAQAPQDAEDDCIGSDTSNEDGCVHEGEDEDDYGEDGNDGDVPPQGAPVKSQMGDDDDDSEHMIVEGEPTEFFKTLSRSHELDEFFEDERFSDEVRYTRALLRLDTYIREGRAVDLDPGSKFRFALPGAKRRLFLLLNGDFDRAINGDDSALQESDIKNLLEPSEPDDASFALQAFLTATKKLNISIQAGARVRKWNPVGFIGPRYRQTFDLESWLMRITQQVRWYTDEGFAIQSVFDFEKSFSRRFFLRITPSAHWKEEDDNIIYGTRAQLFQRLGKHEFLEYQLNVRAETDPVHEIESVVARVRYRRATPWPWLFVEAAPEIAFRNDRDYAFSPGIMIRLDTIFQIDW